MIFDPSSTILITGANRGIGLEFVRQYAEIGCKIIACCRNSLFIDAVQALDVAVEIELLDVASSTSIESLGDRLSGRAIDLVINNAAVRGHIGGLADIDADDFLATMQVNVLAPLLLTRALLPALSSGRGRTVAMISSRAGSITEGHDDDGDYAYRCSKSALNMATAKLAYEFRTLNFFALHPGWVKTDMGGPDAEISASESVAGMRRVLSTLKPGDSGAFLAYNGSTIAW
jgi:NAD(P)-dependent dehydrogenase (short-subunit alcohol dehydrogenase family)